MQKIKISAVSYLNASPFIFGINHSDIKNEIDLSLDIPSVCAEKLIDNKADIGLIPVAAIHELKEPIIITEYCIGSVGKVNSVILLSEVPLNEIKTVLLDYQSLTSSQLTKIICAEHWKIRPEFKNTYKGYEENVKETTAGLVIGDRALLMRNKFKFVFDLSEAWFEMTSLPFIFACWVSNKKLNKDFTTKFNDALKYGVENINQVIAANSDNRISSEMKKEYLEKNINYFLDDEKRKGMKLFFEYMEKEKITQRNCI